MHVRESGSHAGGVTLTAAELGTAADARTISFALTPAHLEAVAGLATPELTIEPGAVQDAFGNPIAGTFDVSTASFVDSFGVSSQDTAPEGVAFSNDGARMFVVGWNDEDINEYDLSAPFDVSTASFVDSFGVSSQDTSPRGMAFSSDGARMFVVGWLDEDINEYALSAPFDVSTASFVDSFGVSSQDTSPRGMAFSSDGAKMFVVGSLGDAIYEYALSAPFDVSTASFVDSFGVSSQDTFPSGVAFSSDGAKMFVVGWNDGDINEYDLTAPFDVSTASFVHSFDISSQDTAPTGVAFSNDGAKMFVAGNQEDAIHEYTLSSTYPIRVTDGTIPTLVSSGLDVATGALTMAFSEAIDAASVAHSKMHVRESGTYEGGVTLTAAELGTAADGSTISFTLTPAHLEAVRGMATPELTIEPGAVQDAFGNPIAGTFDVSTAAFARSFSVSSQETLPRGMAFSSDGTKMFVVGWASNRIHEYALSAPFDVSTAAFANVTFSVSSQDTFPRGMAFSSDGARMFVVGDQGGAIHEYALSAPFDVSTASFVDSFDVSSQDDTPSGMAFSNDGARMFVVGSFGNAIHEYALSAPFDVSTAAFANVTFSVSSQDTSPSGVALSSDGARMFVVGLASDQVHEYALSAPFDVSAATHARSFSVSSQDTSPTGVAFSSDGARMFVVGLNGEDINEYTLSSTYPIRLTDSTIPTLVSSGLDIGTGALTMAFSEAIDAASVVHSKMHVRESGTYEGGVTLTAAELDAAAGGSTISFTLTPAHLEAVRGLATPELTVEPGAVQDRFGNPIAGTFDVSTAEFVDSFDVPSQDTFPTGVAFSNDGARMFVVGLTSDHVHEYALPVPFDVTAASHARSFDVSSQDTQPLGMAFSNDGARMFVVGNSADSVHEYALSAPFDVSTATFVDSFGVSPQDTSPRGMAFSNDGAKMFVVGSSAGSVHEYALSTPFDGLHRHLCRFVWPSRHRTQPRQAWRSQTTAPRCSW